MSTETKLSSKWPLQFLTYLKLVFGVLPTESDLPRVFFPGAEDTRDKLRRQVYEAMAADKKPEDSKPTAESKVAAGLECGSAVAEPLEGQGSGEGPGSPARVVEPAVGAEMKGKEVEQIPVAPATGEGDLSAANESADNDKKVFDEDEDKNAEAESGEGNISLNVEHLSGGICLFTVVWFKKRCETDGGVT